MPPRSPPALCAYPDTVEVPGLRGMEAVSDEVLLAAVLTMANPAADGDALALRLLAGGRTLADVVAAVGRGVAGMGEGELNGGATVRLNALVELAARLVRPSLIRHPAFVERDALVTYCRLRAACVPVEMVRLLFLDDGKRLIADEVHQRGTVDQVTTYAREMLRRALELGARGLVVAHSASRDEPPKPGDARTICADIQRAGKALDLELHAYLLIGRRSYRCLVQESAAKPVRGRSAIGAGKLQSAS